jgi:hypothetical protein
MSRRTLEGARVKGGSIPYIKIGNRCFYRKADVDAYLDSRVRTSTSDDKGARG